MPTYEDNWRLTNEIHPTLGLLNEETIDWEAPVPKPDDGKRYKWNEETVSWVEVVKPTE